MGIIGSNEILALNDNQSTPAVFIKIIAFLPCDNFPFPFVKYVLEIRYRRWEWKVNRRFSEIVSLHRRLNVAMSRIGHQKLMEFRRQHQRPLKKYFGNTNRAFVESRANATEKYLQKLVNDPQILQTRCMREFLAAGASAFVPRFGRKGYEGYLKKCSGGYKKGYSQKYGDFFKSWDRRWFVFFDSGIAYFRDATSSLDHVLGCLHIDDQFKCFLMGKYLRFENKVRTITVSASSVHEAREWRQAFEEFYNSASERKIAQSFGAFSPLRKQIDIKSYICGEQMFRAVAMGILSAKEEIFIAGWMVSPDVYLLRAPDPPIRLDELLKFKAEQGVKIYVILYKEVEMAMPNSSLAAKNHLRSLHFANIQVIRHPNKLLGGATAIFWSHHDKVVVIDNRLAFLGGIDLTYGRYDNFKHQISDERREIWFDKDYYNPGVGMRYHAHQLASIKRQSITTSPVVSTPRQSIYWYLGQIGKKFEIAPNVNTMSKMAKNKLLNQSMDSDEEINHDDASVIMTTDGDILTLKKPENSSHDDEVVQGDDFDQQSTFNSVIGTDSDESDEYSLSNGLMNSEDGNKPKKERKIKEHDSTSQIEFIEEKKIKEEAEERVMREAQNFRYIEPAFIQNSEKKCLDEIEKSENFFSRGYNAIQEGRDHSSSNVSEIEGKSVSTPRSSLPPQQEVRIERVFDRKMYPRMPWHDVHVCLSGRAARDVGYHFIQRWNHHRIAKKLLTKPVLIPPTDDPSFGRCAHCRKPVNEWWSTCSNCGYDLGPPSNLSEPPAEPFQEEEKQEQPPNNFEANGQVKVGYHSLILGDNNTNTNIQDTFLVVAVPAEQNPSVPFAFPTISIKNPQTDNSVPQLTMIDNELNDQENTGFSFIEFENTYLEGEKIDVQITGDSPVYVNQLLPKTQPKNPSNQEIQIGDVLIAINGECTLELNFWETQQLIMTLPRPINILFRRSINKDITKNDDINLQSKIHQQLKRGSSIYMSQVQLVEDLPIRIERFKSSSGVQDLLPSLGVGSCNVQILRSIGDWSLGSPTEHSIMDAYCHAIKKSEHFLYFENQFFVSSSDNKIENHVVDWVFDRLSHAIKYQEKFRCIIVLPLHPEGDFINEKSVSAVMHYQFSTLNRGKKSLFNRLYASFPDVVLQDYISIFSLRSYGELSDAGMVAEQVYVHDKLLIVDDMKVIIGSANINDRSLLGNRDSEIAALIEDNEMVDSLMNSQPWKASKFAHDLRVRLWKVHLGNESIDVTDPICDEVYKNILLATAKKNTWCYESAIDGKSAMNLCETLEKYTSQLVDIWNHNLLLKDIRMGRKTQSIISFDNSLINTKSFDNSQQPEGLKRQIYSTNLSESNPQQIIKPQYDPNVESENNINDTQTNSIGSTESNQTNGNNSIRKYSTTPSLTGNEKPPVFVEGSEEVTYSTTLNSPLPPIDVQRAIMSEVKGFLVMFPTEFLSRETLDPNRQFAAEALLPSQLWV